MLYPLSYEGGYRSLREGANRLFYGPPSLVRDVPTCLPSGH